MTQPAHTRNAPVWATILLALIGIVLIVVAVVYFAEPAKSLPAFFPGHQAGATLHHTKHGLLALIVGLIALAAAWLTSGKKKTAVGL